MSIAALYAALGVAGVFSLLLSKGMLREGKYGWALAYWAAGMFLLAVSAFNLAVEVTK